MMLEWEDFKSMPLFFDLYGQEAFTKEKVLELCERSFEAGYDYGYIKGEEQYD